MGWLSELFGGSKNDKPMWRDLELRANAMWDQNQGIITAFHQAQQQFADSMWNKADQMGGMTDALAYRSLDTGAQALDAYKNIGLPAEKQVHSDLMTWDSPARTEQRAASAIADVSSAAEAQRQQALDRLASYGIDPSQVAMTGLDKRLGAATAAMQAAAGTKSRRDTEKEGLANKLTAVDLGRGWAATGGSLATTGAEVGKAGAEMRDAAIRARAASAGAATEMGNSLLNSYSNAKSAQIGASAERTPNRGFLGDLVGLGAGAAFGLEDGGYIDPSVSPSEGEVEDDIPAAVSAHEVVLPEEVVQYFGLKALNKMFMEATGKPMPNHVGVPT